MGQSPSSSQLQDLVPPLLSQLIADETSVNTLITSEINSLTYENFVKTLGELNLLSKKCLDSSGNQLVFAVKKGTDSTMFWKGTVQIACVKIDPVTKQIDNYRLLNLIQFLKVCKTLKCQCLAAEHSKTGSQDYVMPTSALFNNLDVASGNECCICFERKPNVLLPCAHSYCMQCIEEWNQIHDTCPICREKLQSTEDTWELSEVPKAEEISAEIRSNLMNLSENKPSPPCSPS